MKKYTKPSMEIVDLHVEDKINADTTFYRRGINVLGNGADASAAANLESGKGVTTTNISF